MDALGDFLTSVEAMMNDWIGRQHEAFDASSRLIQKISEARNVIDLVQAQHEWLSDCLHWTASEVRAVGSDAAAMTRKAAERLGEAVRESSNELRQKTKVRTKTEADIPIQRAAAE